MYQKIWASDQRKNLICIDSYEDGVPKGRFFDDTYDCIPFKSLSQFLLRMEQVLNDKQLPQSYTTPRTFASRSPEDLGETDLGVRRGRLATFEIRVLFRQSSSWQGSIRWNEKDMEQSFRSVMELIVLMDSALTSE